MPPALGNLGEREIWSLAYVRAQHVMHDLRQARFRDFVVLGLVTNRTAVAPKFEYGLSMVSKVTQSL